MLFVGGTPLYLKGLLRGIFEGPPADWPLRRQVADEAARHGGDWLHQRLAEVDPVAAARLHPNDARRLIRAIEVYEKTGQPISQLQRQFEVGRPAADCRVFVLDWPKAELLRGSTAVSGPCSPPDWSRRSAGCVRRSPLPLGEG